MRFIEIRFSPEAKHFWKWLHTWLALAAASAPFVYDNIETVQGFLPAAAVKWVTAGIISLMVYNSTRKK